jgi:hypothetical protein
VSDLVARLRAALDGFNDNWPASLLPDSLDVADIRAATDALEAAERLAQAVEQMHLGARSSNDGTVTIPRDPFMRGVGDALAAYRTKTQNPDSAERLLSEVIEVTDPRTGDDELTVKANLFTLMNRIRAYLDNRTS